MRIISKGIIDYYEKFLLVLEPNESDEMGDRLEFYLNIDNGVRSILWVSGVPPEEITDEIIDELSTEAGKKEKEIVEKYQPYIPTQEDLNKLQELFEKKYNQKIETDEKV